MVATDAKDATDGEDATESEDGATEEKPDENLWLEANNESLEFRPIDRHPRTSRGSGRSVKFLLAFLVALAMGAAWFVWGAELFGSKTKPVPLIKAEAGPIKMRPDRPGGLDVPNRDKLIYERLEKDPPKSTTETLLSRPEVPLPPSPKPPAPSATKAPPAAPPLPKPGQRKPGRAATAAIKPPALASPPPPPPTSSSDQADALAGSFLIQIAALRSAEAARQEWLRLRNKHKDVLGGLKLVLVRADLGAKGIYFRLRAGPFRTRETAKSACLSLAERKIGCLIIRPGA